MDMKFQIYQDKKEEWRWRLIADNSNIIADSAEGYKNKSDCVHEIYKIKEDARSASIEEG